MFAPPATTFNVDVQLLQLDGAPSGRASDVIALAAGATIRFIGLSTFDLMADLGYKVQDIALNDEARHSPISAEVTARFFQGSTALGAVTKTADVADPFKKGTFDGRWETRPHIERSVSAPVTVPASADRVEISVVATDASNGRRATRTAVSALPVLPGSTLHAVAGVGPTTAACNALYPRGKRVELGDFVDAPNQDPSLGWTIAAH